MLKRKNITEMEIGQEFVVEYGCYGNYTTAIIKDIRPTNYPQIKIVDYTIPNYTGEKIHTDKMVWVEVREIQPQQNKKIFKKTLDKLKKVCYNNYRK